jgi:hypothetical protein
MSNEIWRCSPLLQTACQAEIGRKPMAPTRTRLRAVVHWPPRCAARLAQQKQCHLRVATFEIVLGLSNFNQGMIHERVPHSRRNLGRYIRVESLHELHGTTPLASRSSKRSNTKRSWATNTETCPKRKLRSASSSRKSTIRSGFTRRSVICRPLNSKPISRLIKTGMPLRGGFLYEFSKTSGDLPRKSKASRPVRDHLSLHNG